MSGEPIVTIVGNLTGDPELRFLSSGVSVVNFTVASTPKTLNRQTNQWQDGEAMFVRCTVWREYAENIAETLTKGMRVVVTGKLTVRSYEHDGVQRTSLQLAVEGVGPDLRYATAQVTKIQRQQGQNGQQGYGGNQDTRDPQAYAPAYGTGTAPAGSAGDQHDPWAQNNTFSDLPPF